MQVISLIWGIAAILGMFVGLIPCLGWWNWGNIPFSVVGIIISAIAYNQAGDKPKGSSMAGLICCGIACFFGIIRLIIGGGVF